ncbi:MAG: hypothetical protein ABW321_03855 [Polyangiales bacterium]
MLTEEQLRLYARQVIVDELGRSGQERLCASVASIPEGADPRAARVAADYLQRAGLHVAADGGQVPLPAADIVRSCAGDPALEECAAWLHGAWAAVEVVKARVGVGTPAALAHDWVLNAEGD